LPKGQRVDIDAMFVNYLQTCTLSASEKLQKVMREGSEQV
jgi:hypothetical protein